MEKPMDAKLGATLLSEGDKVVVAVSGGRDSMALLHWFINHAQKLGVSFFVVNIEHGIRGESSIDDSKFVADFCEKNGVEVKQFFVDVPKISNQKKLTIEQTARDARYEVFTRLYESGECNKVATAHHMDDDAETVLMRICRGTGLRGLRGISESVGFVVRPFLGLTREQIDRYVLENNVPYVEDETNSETIYMRNFFRHEVLPLIKSRYPDVVKSLVRLSRNAAEAEDYLEKSTPELIEQKGVVKICPVADDIINKRMLFNGFRRLKVFADIEERHVMILLRLIRAQNGSRFDMPYGVTAYNENGQIVLTRGCQSKDFKFALSLPFAAACGELFLNIEPYDGGAIKKGELVFDGNKIPEGAVVRCRAENDVFKKFKGGTKSLGDFLTDKKIPLRIRDSLPIIAKDSTVYAVCGIEIADSVKADDLTRIQGLYKITLEEIDQ